MDTIKQLKEEAQQLHKRLETLEQAIENVGNCKREPKPGEIWETEGGIEFLVCEHGLLINLSDFDSIALAQTAIDSSTYRCMFDEYM